MEYFSIKNDDNSKLHTKAVMIALIKNKKTLVSNNNNKNRSVKEGEVV